jgi:AsmA protein
MKTWIKRILIGLVVVVVAAVVGLAIFLLTFDPNAYKYKLEELIQARYHRTLTIDGEIQLSLFPRIGLALQNVSLSEPDSTDKFASMASARLAVQVWPLLSNALVVDNVAISGFKARVVRKLDGHFNFENLVGPDDAAAQAADGLNSGGTGTSASGTRFQIDIAGLDLKDGEILLQDNVRNRAVAFTALNATTGRVTFNQPFTFNVSARAAGGDPRVDAAFTGQAMLTLDPSARRYSAQKIDLRLNGQLPDAQAKSLSLRGNLAYNGHTGSLDASALEMVFQGEVTRPGAKMTGVEASIAVPKLVIDPHKKRLQVDKLAVRAKGTMNAEPFELAIDTPALNVTTTSASGDALTGRLRLDGENGWDASFGFNGISGNADELDIQESKFNATSKEGARLVKVALSSPLTLNLSQRAAAMSALRGDVTITDPALPKGILQIPLIGSVSADLHKDEASAKINAVLEGGKFDLSATIARLTHVPAIAFSLAVDTLDLDKLAPPLAVLQKDPGPVPAAPVSGATPAAGAAPPVAAAAPAPAPASSGGAAAAASGNLDFSALVGPAANGTVQIGRLILRGLKADEVAANVKLEKGKLTLNTLSASLYDGKLAGVVSLDARQNNALVTKLSLAGVSLEPLLTDIGGGPAGLSGRGSIVVDLTTAGANSYAMTNALGGTLQLRLREGSVRGINIVNTLRDLRNAVRDGDAQAAAQMPEAQGAKPAEAGTAAVAANAAGGSAATPAAAAPASAAPVASGPHTDFTSLDVDVAFAGGVGEVKTLALASPILRIAQGKPASFNLVNRTLDIMALVRLANPVAGADSGDLTELANIVVPLHVAGPFDKPAYSVQWRGVVNDLAKNVLEKKLIDAAANSHSKHAQEVGDIVKGLLKK